MSEVGNRPYGRDPQGVIWPDRLVVGRGGSAPAPMPVPPGGGARRRVARAEKGGGTRLRLAAVAGAGVVTFAGTLLAMNVAFGGSEGSPPKPQALEDCDSPGCAIPSDYPTTSPSAAPTRSKVAKPSKSPTPTPSASSKAATTPSATPGDRRSSEPERPSRDRPQRPWIAPPQPARPTVTVNYSGSDNGWRESRGSYTVTNHGGDTLRSWRLTFDLDRGRLLSLWPLPYHRYGDTIVVDGGALGAGSSHTFTFLASGYSVRPSDCTLNGSPCVSG